MKFYRFFYKRHSKIAAKDRLRVLLISDRINCSQETLELMKKDKRYTKKRGDNYGFTSIT